MKRASLLLMLVLAFLPLLVPAASAEHSIGATPVQMIPIDQYGKVAEWGQTTTFQWGLFNSDNQTPFSISSTISTDQDGFEATVSPSNFIIEAEQFSRIFVNVTGTTGGAHVKTTITLHILVSGTSNGEDNFTAILDAMPKTTILDTATSFIAIGFIILVGFSASWFFERTSIPDVLFLIFLGLILGPIATQYLGVTLVPPRMLTIVTPYVAALALVMILFDGGLNLSLDSVLSKLGISALHTVVTFLLSVAIATSAAILILGYPLVVGLLLGVILGGTSGAIVLTLVRKMHVHEDTKCILVIESVVTDVLCVILALSIVTFLTGGPNASLGSILPILVASFSIAIIVALVFGVLWLRLLTRLSGKPFAYMVTIAALLVLYAAVEASGGSGAMAALVFGLVLGNHGEIARMFKIKSGFVMDEKIKQFQTELSFVIRTFFFVFLGLVFTLDIGGSWAVSTGIPLLSELNGTFFLLALGIAIIFIGLIAVRYFTSALTSRIHVESRQDRGAIWFMMGRGLAAAVLASIPFAIPAFNDPSNPAYTYYRGLLGPYQAHFINITFLIILLTVIATTIGVANIERKRSMRPPPSPEEMERLRHREAVAEWKKKEAQQYRERVRKKKEWRKRKDS